MVINDVASGDLHKEHNNVITLNDSDFKTANLHLGDNRAGHHGHGRGHAHDHDGRGRARRRTSPNRRGRPGPGQGAQGQGQGPQGLGQGPQGPGQGQGLQGPGRGPRLQRTPPLRYPSQLTFLLRKEQYCT